MLKRLVSLSIAALLLHAADVFPLPALARTAQSEQQAAKVKADVTRRGTGKKARVVVRLQDGSKLKGYVSQAGNDSFTLTDSRSGQTRTLSYGDVARVNKPGGLPLGAKIGIGMGALMGVLALVYAAGCHDTSAC
ncbi:MAG TPA: hypothetical protein VF064_15125 [Pyrinomonadaceae bacterium]